VTSVRSLRWLAAVVALAALATLAAGCGGGRDALTIYSGRTENLIGPLLERFAEESGISIDVRYGDSADLALLIAEEGDQSPADVILSQSPGPVGFLAQRDLLAPLEPETLERVDAGYRSQAGLWVGLSARQRVLVYNSELVEASELPDSVLDLTDPRFAEQVAVAPSNGSFQDFVSVMRQAEGDEATEAWLAGMAENDSVAYANNNAIVEAVGRGEIPMGLVNHYYNYRFLEEDPGLPSRNHVFPGGDIGAALLFTTASVTASSERREDATAFIEFLLSNDAQRYYAEETFEYPLAPGVEPAADLPPLATLELPEYSIEELGAELEGTARMIAESGLDG
jgi:iron(III) transport system substrate-binding protein